MMHILLFIAYAAVLIFILSRSKFLLGSGLSAKVLGGLFLLFTAFGCLHVWTAFHFYPAHGDIWQMFAYSTELKKKLLTDYQSFADDFFPDRFSVDIVGTHLGWSHDQMQVLTLLSLALDFLSFDNLYINTLLFCFLTMWGKISFYRMLRQRYPGRPGMAFFLSFLIPSLMFWTSVIHKEAVLFCSLGVLLYASNKFIRQQRSMRAAGAIVLCLLIIFVTRKVILAPLLPALAIWWVWEATAIPKKLILPVGCMLPVICFIVAGFLHPSLNVLLQVSERQQAYFQLSGGSEIFVPALDGSAGSFISAFPYAVVNGLFMPLPGFGGKWIYNVFFVELLGIWAWAARSAYLSITSKKKIINDGFKAGMILFSLFACLMIGYTVPFVGAIVRYRSIFYPFLLLPLIDNFELAALTDFLSKKTMPPKKN